MNISRSKHRYGTFYCVLAYRNHIVTERAADDLYLDSFDDTIFVAKLSRVRN